MKVSLVGALVFCERSFVRSLQDASASAIKALTLDDAGGAAAGSFAPSFLIGARQIGAEPGRIIGDERLPRLDRAEFLGALESLLLGVAASARGSASRRRSRTSESLASLDELLDLVASAREVERGGLVARHEIIEQLLLGKNAPQRIVVADVHLHAAQTFFAGGAKDLALERVIEAAAGHAQLGILAVLEIADIGAESDDGEICTYA